MTLYEYIRSNEETVRTLIRMGAMSTKYLLWLDMYEYVNARSRGKKKQRLSGAEVMNNAAQVFGTTPITIYRANKAMKQKIKPNTINGKFKQ